MREDTSTIFTLMLSKDQIPTHDDKFCQQCIKGTSVQMSEEFRSREVLCWCDMHAERLRRCLWWWGWALSVHKGDFSLLDSYLATAVDGGLEWREHGRAVMSLGARGRNCERDIRFWVTVCLHFKCRNMGYCGCKILSCDLWDIVRSLQGFRWVPSHCTSIWILLPLS